MQKEVQVALAFYATLLTILGEYFPNVIPKGPRGHPTIRPSSAKAISKGLGAKLTK